MTDGMTSQELMQLIEHVHSEHSPMFLRQLLERRIVKYMDPHVDMRDNCVFSVTFRGYGWEETIHTQNECRGLADSLFLRCMNFLDKV